jgi:putative tryptophan/tyrosine transport system substrate-binding protein
MRRREFMTLVGGATFVWPLAAGAQQADPMRHVGVLVGNAANADDLLTKKELGPFQMGMRDAGWIEGKTIHVEYRYGAGDPAKIQTAAADLVALAPDLIYAITLKAVQAVSQKTSTIPIVFSLVADSVGMGVVASLSHPGGNVTGFDVWDPTISGKWLQLLKEVSPDIGRVGIIFNPDVAPYAASFISAGKRAAGQGLDLLEFPVRDDPDIESAAMSIGREPHGALWVIADPFTTAHTDRIVAEALRFRLPSVYGNSLQAQRGGLISYANASDLIMRQPVSYIDRILKGDKPGNLPVQTPVKYELVINLKTAKMLGLSVPSTLLSTADEVIE